MLGNHGNYIPSEKKNSNAHLLKDKVYLHLQNFENVLHGISYLIIYLTDLPLLKIQRLF